MLQFILSWFKKRCNKLIAMQKHYFDRKLKKTFYTCQLKNINVVSSFEKNKLFITIIFNILLHNDYEKHIHRAFRNCNNDIL